MATEIERKFLVKGSKWKETTTGTLYRQGYLSTAHDRTVRVRTIDDRGFLTVKGPLVGISRMEFEYEIPLRDADELLDHLSETPLIEKTRYTIDYRGFTWEIDEFHGENEGLVLAEVELNSADQQLDLPDWVGDEVSDDPRYLNVNLAKNPFRRW